MRRNRLPQRNGGVIAGEDDAVGGGHEEVIPIPKRNLAPKGEWDQPTALD